MQQLYIESEVGNGRNVSKFLYVLFHDIYVNHVFSVCVSGCLASEHSDYRGVHQQIQPDLLLHVATEADRLGPEGRVAPTEASRSVQPYYR